MFGLVLQSRRGTLTDLAAAIKICQDAGYKGLYTVVTAESAEDPTAATRAVLSRTTRPCARL